MPDENGNLTPDERTTPLGLYHFAVTYEEAGKMLMGKLDRRRATHPESPIDHLFTHAIELFCKSFLRLHGATLDDLKYRLGHAMPKICAAFDAAGGHLDDEDREVFALLTPENVFGSRYLIVGPFKRAHTDALARTAKSLHQTVRESLTGAGIRTRH